MSQNNDSLALLPSGFVDLLPPDAAKEAQAITMLMARFEAFGYNRVKPPFLEFEESLLGPGPGSFLAPDTFRLMDPVSHRMVGMRADITAQIARIASSRLVNEPRPLRLTYANDVLRTRSSQLRTERQFCQVGCEIIGDGSVDTDVEICILALIGLKDIGIEDITIDLNIPGFVARLMEGEDTDEDMRAKIEKAMHQRDRDVLEGLSMPVATKIAQAMDAAGGAEEALQALEAMNLKGDLVKDIETLRSVYKEINKALHQLDVKGVCLTLDVLDQPGFEYHKGLGFTLFSTYVHGELGRGGCYDVRFGENDETETARGFTLYMDTIRKALATKDTPPKIYVSSTESWSVMQDLQNEGWVVVRGAQGCDFPDGCSHQYKDGEVVEIKE